MAEISFNILVDENTSTDIYGSGLGFFSSNGFGYSVSVGEYQGRTYATDPNGAVQGPEAQNVKYIHPSSGILGQEGLMLLLQHIPNYQSTLNIRFTHDEAVQVENAQLRIYDRTLINNAPSGVTCKAAEIIHPSPIQEAGGSGDATWLTPAGSSDILDLANSPGISGLYADDGVSSIHQDTRHDWYVALSASPNSVGSKTLFGLYFDCEYF